MQVNEENEGPRWTPLGAQERRVLGVLVEKAKTTPDNYPLSLNALKNGCNQKSNRFPQMDLDEDRVADALDGLREKRAVTFVQGDSRVEKYRHLAYDWLGVDKLELAVMAELLLRGAQTVGELRGRAARMEPIKGMGELQPVLASLVEKQMVVYLTPPGRGAVVTHLLYQPQELDKVRRDHGGGGAAVPQPGSAPNAPAQLASAQPSSAQPSAAPSQQPGLRQAAAPADAPGALSSVDTSDLRAEITALRAEFEQAIGDLRSEVEELQRRLNG